MTSGFDRTTHVLVNGDSRNMTKMPAESVELIVTSPPYWQLKDYGSSQQIGFHDSYEDYINDLNLVWSECNRILKPGCRLCINIGDQFARSVYYGRYKVIPIRTEIIRFCETIGLDYMGAVIWQKQTTMNTTGGGAIMGSFPYPRNGILKIDYEFILIFKKQGKSPVPTAEQKRRSELSKEDWSRCFSSHWTFGGARQDGHIAVFPEELPSRLIKMFTFVGETVFDPFMGSGTTALAARHLGRNSIGYEINKDFRHFYADKVSPPDLLSAAECRFEDDLDSFLIEDRKDELPYLFHDGYLREKSVVNDGLAKRFPNVRFEESDTELDHAGDVDYVAHVGSRQFGIQVRPVTAHSNYAGYSLTERMKASFASFEETYGGKVFVVFSIDGEIANPEVVDDIAAEIARLSRLSSSEPSA
jgi:modification methylase